jgi:hypothetical protein
MRRRLFNILAAVSGIFKRPIPLPAWMPDRQQTERYIKVAAGPFFLLNGIFYLGCSIKLFSILSSITSSAALPGYVYWLLSLPLIGSTVCFWLGYKLIRRERDQRRRRILNLCPTCSYNLTGNVSGVCPECGTAILARINTPEP